MSKTTDKPSSIQSPLTSRKVTYAGIGWAVLSLLFFMLFSARVPGTERPFWYLLSTYILEGIPFFVAALLCYRNWRSPNIISGRNVWLGIGLGMLCFFIADFLFGWWELYWKLNPDVSPADLFYMACYVFLSWGMILAVLPRRLNLELRQWGIVAVIAILGISLAIAVTVATPPDNPQKTGEATQASVTQLVSFEATSYSAQATPGTSQSNPSATSTTSEADAEENKQVPSWVKSIQNTLDPLSTPVNLFYIVGDVILLIIASTLLLAFWGGRFAQSWRMIAAATFCLYIADMWFKYKEATAAEYESGSLLEVFYVFSGVLFAIGAALEYDVSSQPHRRSRRRT